MSIKYLVVFFVPSILIGAFAFLYHAPISYVIIMIGSLALFLLTIQKFNAKQERYYRDHPEAGEALKARYKAQKASTEKFRIEHPVLYFIFQLFRTM